MNKVSRRSFVTLSQLLVAGCATRNLETGTLSDIDSFPTPRGMFSNIANGEMLKFINNPTEHLLKLAQDPEVENYGVALLNRFKLPIFLVTDPEECRSLLKNKDGVDKSLFQQSVSPVFGNGIVISYASENTRTLRKRMNPLFKPKVNRSSVEDLVAETEVYAADLKNRILQNEGEIEIDFAKETTALLQRSLLRSLFGYIDGNTTSRVSLESLQKEWKLMVVAMEELSHNFISVNKRPGSRLKKQRKESRVVVAQFFEDLLNHVTKNSEKLAPNTLTQIISHLPSEFSKQEKVNHLITLFAASHETTANTLNFTQDHLCRNKLFVNKMREAPKGSAKNVSEDSLTDSDWALSMAMEGLRLAPPLWFLPRTIIKDDVRVANRLLPKGSMVFISPLITQRLPEFWVETTGKESRAQLWNETSKFNPTRFLPRGKTETAAEVRESLDKGIADFTPKASNQAFLAFGYGHRSCPGRALGQADLQTLILKLNTQFEFTQTNEKPPDVIATWMYRGKTSKVKVALRN